MNSKQSALPGFGGLVKTAKRTGTVGRRGKKLSVQLDGPRYLAIRLAAIDTGMSHQDIMVAAFDAWLRTHEIAKAINPASE